MILNVVLLDIYFLFNIKTHLNLFKNEIANKEIEQFLLKFIFS